MLKTKRVSRFITEILEFINILYKKGDENGKSVRASTSKTIPCDSREYYLKIS